VNKTDANTCKSTTKLKAEQDKNKDKFITLKKYL